MSTGANHGDEPFYYQQPPAANQIPHQDMSNPYQNPYLYQERSNQQLSPIGQPMSENDKTTITIIHLLGPLATVLSVGTLGLIGPLIAWLYYKNHSPLIARHAAEAFNFQLTMWITIMISLLLIISVLGIVIGLPLLFGASIFSFVMGIVAAIKVNKGIDYRYPLTWRILG